MIENCCRFVKYPLLTKRFVNMAGYWPSWVLYFYGPSLIRGQQKRRWERGQCPASLSCSRVVTQRALRDDTKGDQYPATGDNYVFLGNCPPTPPLSQHYFSLRPKCWFRGRVGWQFPRSVWSTWSTKAYYLVKKTCRFLRTIHGQKFHTLLSLYQDITKPRAPISPSGRSTDRRPSAGMSPVPRGPKVKEHLRQPFLTHNIFATHFVSWPQFWMGGGIAHPHFHRQSLVTERIRSTGFPTMQSHVSIKSWLLLLCKLSSRLKTF